MHQFPENKGVCLWQTNGGLDRLVRGHSMGREGLFLGWQMADQEVDWAYKEMGPATAAHAKS